MNMPTTVFMLVSLFQGRLGFEKAIILLEEGCKEFTNIGEVLELRP